MEKITANRQKRAKNAHETHVKTHFALSRVRARIVPLHKF